MNAVLSLCIKVLKSYCPQIVAIHSYQFVLLMFVNEIILFQTLGENESARIALKQS